MTILESKTETDTKNIILECSSKITFEQVSENLKKILKTINKSYFKKEYVFLNIELFYKFTGKLEKETHTEQYFIIFLKSNKEFSALINNPHINMEEINKKDINFIFVIPNSFKDIHNEDNYYLYNHIYLDIQPKPKKVEINENLTQEEILSKGGFHALSDFAQLDILEDINLKKEELSRLQFHRVISEEVNDYYLKYIYKKTFIFKQIKHKLSTLF